MDVAALAGIVTGGVAAAIGIASFAFSAYKWRQERCDRKAEIEKEGRLRKEELAEERRLRSEELAEERRHRQEQFELEKRKFEAEAELELKRYKDEIDAREALRHAEITASQGDFVDGDFTYTFTLKNLGPSWAKHVSAVLITGTADLRISMPSTGFPLDSGQERTITLSLLPKWRDKVERTQNEWGVRLLVMWYDLSGGEYREHSNVFVRLIHLEA